jgi:2-dehydro-3-deoxyphosphogluconate aldolase/(4S)-4-hydroxy-2-oxoglutarate aldolase
MTDRTEPDAASERPSASGTEVERRIGAARVVPVLRLPDADAAVHAVDDCFEAGLDVVELTATTTGWQEALRRVRAAHPDRLVGVGTVLEADAARAAIDLGADFLVSPFPVPPVRDVAGTTPFVEGGMTVTELVDAGSRGLAKLFPAHVGGPQFLRSVLAVAPGLRIIPTGGIRLGDVPTWLDAGAFAVGVGSDLVAALYGPSGRATLEHLLRDPD